jgi:hypothetical protein
MGVNPQPYAQILAKHAVNPHRVGEGSLSLAFHTTDGTLGNTTPSKIPGYVQKVGVFLRGLG